MNLIYTITLKDYKAALRLHLRQKLSRRIWRALFPTVAVIGLVFLLAFNVSGKTESGADVIAVVVGLIIISIALPIARIFDARIGFNRLLRSTKKNPNISIDIGDECIFSTIPGVSEGKFFWNAIADFAQDERITMLYLDKRRFLFFPTNVLSSAERTELHAFVERNMVKRKPC